MNLPDDILIVGLGMTVWQQRGSCREMGKKITIVDENLNMTFRLLESIRRYQIYRPFRLSQERRFSDHP